MKRIEKRDGFVYLVQGDKGFETYYNLGKDIDDPRWKEDEEELEEIPQEKPKKTNKKAKKEDTE